MLIMCSPGAMSSLRIEDSPFGPYDFINPSNSPISPPGSVGDGWPTRAKSPHASSNVNWPPGLEAILFLFFVSSQHIVVMVRALQSSDHKCIMFCRVSSR